MSIQRKYDIQQAVLEARRSAGSSIKLVRLHENLPTVANNLRRFGFEPHCSAGQGRHSKLIRRTDGLHGLRHGHLTSHASSQCRG